MSADDVDPAEPPPGRWAVWRIDDTGNTFVVREHLDQVEAKRLVDEFTARGHKQTYWAEREACQADRGVAADAGGQ